MKTIFKYPIPVQDEVILDLPEGAQVLSFKNQHEELFIWALVDTEVLLKPRYFRLLGTGGPANGIDERFRFVGTAQLSGGSFIGHLFELIQ